MLGVCLLFVGIVLINNGMCTLYNVDGKSTGSYEYLYRWTVTVYQFCKPGTGKLLCGRNRTSVLLYLPVCSFFNKILKLSPYSICVVFNICSDQCSGIWNHWRDFWEATALGITAGYPLGRNLVSLGNPLGNMPLWRTSWAKNSENLFRRSR